MRPCILSTCANAFYVRVPWLTADSATQGFHVSHFFMRLIVPCAHAGRGTQVVWKSGKGTGAAL